MQTSENANFVNFAEFIFPRTRVNNPGLKRRGTWGLLRVRGDYRGGSEGDYGRPRRLRRTPTSLLKAWGPRTRATQTSIPRRAESNRPPILRKLVSALEVAPEDLEGEGE